jgi:hypothetical protein
MSTPAPPQPRPPKGTPDRQPPEDAPEFQPEGAPEPQPEGAPEPQPPVRGAPTGRVADSGNRGDRLSTAPGSGARGPSASRGPSAFRGRPGGRSRVAVLAGVGMVVLYLVGAVVSGRASLLARRPLLDGLAPPTPYRWVNPPPELAAGNKAPASTRFTVKLQADGSRLGAFSTNDGQINLVLSESAVPARSGQTDVEVAVDPVDPAPLGTPPAGLVVAGNAYRIQASYQPSGAKVEALGGQSSVGLVYPLLATAVADVGGHVVLSSPDGRTWKQLASTDTPGTHQVSAQLNTTGFVAVGVPPSVGGSGSDQRSRILLLASAVAVAIVAAALMLRFRATSRAGPRGGRGVRGGARRRRR